jgi:hypothetical protein
MAANLSMLKGNRKTRKHLIPQISITFLESTGICLQVHFLELLCRKAEILQHTDGIFASALWDWIQNGFLEHSYWQTNFYGAITDPNET